MATTDDQDLMNTREVAEFLNVNTSRVRQLALSGELPGRLIRERFQANDIWVFTRDDVVAYAARRRPVGRPKKTDDTDT